MRICHFRAKIGLFPLKNFFSETYRQTKYFHFTPFPDKTNLKCLIDANVNFKNQRMELMKTFVILGTYATFATM